MVDPLGDRANAMRSKKPQKVLSVEGLKKALRYKCWPNFIFPPNVFFLHYPSILVKTSGPNTCCYFINLSAPSSVKITSDIQHLIFLHNEQ